MVSIGKSSQSCHSTPMRKKYMIAKQKEEKNQKKKTSTYDRSGIFSRYFYLYMVPLFAKGFFQRQIEPEDLDEPPVEDGSKLMGKKLELVWQRELEKHPNKPSFARALFSLVGLRLILVSLFELFSRCVAYPMQAVILGWLVRDIGLYKNYRENQFHLMGSINNNTISDDAYGANFNHDTLKNLSLEADNSNLVDQDLLVVRDSYQRLVMYSLMLVVMSCLAVVSGHPFFFLRSHIAMKARVSTCHLLYKKSLRLSHSAMSQTTVGQMVNLLSNDVNRFDQASGLLSYLAIAPIQTAVIVYLLAFHYMTISTTLIIMVTITGYSMIQSYVSQLFGALRRKTALRTDERVRLMNEIICSIRVIKMYGWEQSFEKLVEEARKSEVDYIRRAASLRTINSTMFFSSMQIMVFVGLITYVSLGYELDPETVYVSMALINLARTSLCFLFPQAISQGAEMLVVCERIQKFLLLEDITNQEVARLCTNETSKEYYVKFLQLDASWHRHAKSANKEAKIDNNNNKTSHEINVIRNLSFELKERQLLIIVGRVGSGKSSVLLSILGELPVDSGKVEINGRISYASQEAWIFSGTIRDNVLFGRTFNSERYTEVLNVCSLDSDLRLFHDGDLTLVGERGVSLSGGQKARVNLARALYYDADIYLLDDPLSAVDTTVAEHIFNQCMRTFLAKKIVLLATHQLQFLRHASKVLVMDNFLPSVFGTLEEVMAAKTFASVNYSRKSFEDATSKSTGNHLEVPLTDFEFTEHQIADIESATKTLEKESQPVSKTNNGKHQPITSINKDENNYIERDNKEKVNTVSADTETYMYYLRSAAGPIILAIYLLFNVLLQMVLTFTDFWLSFWTDSEQRKTAEGDSFVEKTLVDRLGIGQTSMIYAALVVTIFLMVLMRTGLAYLGSMRASINLHNKLFRSILKSPMVFFDFTAAGTLLNRISRDIGIIDDLLPATGIDIIYSSFQVAGILATTLIINPWNIVPSLSLLCLGILLRHISARTIRRLKQIEGVSRSPVFSHLSTTLHGISTIRAFEVEDSFIDRFDTYQDDHSGAWFLYMSSCRWLTLWMDWICLLFIACMIIILILVSFDGSNASLVGLLVSQSVMIPPPFQWGLRQFTELESQMTSVQRIREYSRLQSESNLLNPNEDQKVDSGDTIKNFKPSQGEIVFKDIALRYFKQEQPVLKNLNFRILPGEKVGVVGRTGAGKSSIMALIFRLYPYDGSIFIDSQDTKFVPITDLRRSISIIPQDPILFRASIRKNLDPFDEYADYDLWQALEAVRLKPLFLNSGKGLDFVIDEGGKNFSVGQKQLICVARAIVRRNKVLVLDEATANVDPETDTFIQKAIREKFSECTVLTIAHRLGTVMDSDRILVLDAGQVKEFDKPHILLNKPDSLLTMMADSTGEHADKLRRLASESYRAKRLEVINRKDSPPVFSYD